jgi:hypothetical protein
VAMTERLPLDPQTRRGLKLEVSRRRREMEVHVGRPVLHLYSKQAVSDRDPRQAAPSRNPNSQPAPASVSHNQGSTQGVKRPIVWLRMRRACVCGHVRTQKDHQLSRAAPCDRRRHTDGCYTVPGRTRGCQERARAERPVRRPGTHPRQRRIATTDDQSPEPER